MKMITNTPNQRKKLVAGKTQARPTPWVRLAIEFLKPRQLLPASKLVFNVPQPNLKLKPRGGGLNF
jgi:hypothetical protein